MHEFMFLPFTFGPLLFLGFLVLMTWTIVWKGLALWKAAQLSDKWWFIALLVINTAGILEILYIYLFSKRDTSQDAPDADKN